jgi:hypothetical protein
MSRITMPTPTTGSAPSHSPPDMLYAPGIGLARKLGWFSIALGVAELVAPRALGRMIGVDNNLIVRAYGIREIGTGIAILQSSRPTGWMWGRVAGDALDVATLLTASGNSQPDRKRALVATAAVCGVAALDTLCAAQLSAAAALEG